MSGAKTTKKIPDDQETDREFESKCLEQQKSQATCVKNFKVKLRFRKDQQDILLIIKDKSAINISWKYHLELRKSASQTSTCKDFPVQVESAANKDYQAKMPQNDPQICATKEFEGKFGLLMDRQDKAECVTSRTDRKDVGRNSGNVENLKMRFESMAVTKGEKKTALHSKSGNAMISGAGAVVDEKKTNAHFRSSHAETAVEVHNLVCNEVASNNKLENRCISDRAGATVFFERPDETTLCEDDLCACEVDIDLQYNDCFLCINGTTDPFDHIRTIFKNNNNIPQNPRVDLVVLFTDGCKEVLTVNTVKNHHTLKNNQVYFKHINPGDQIDNDSIFFKVEFVHGVQNPAVIILINLATLLAIAVTCKGLYAIHPSDLSVTCNPTKVGVSCFDWLDDIITTTSSPTSSSTSSPNYWSYYFSFHGTNPVIIYPADGTTTERVSKAHKNLDPPAIIDDTDLEFCVRTVCACVEINGC